MSLAYLPELRSRNGDNNYSAQQYLFPSTPAQCDILLSFIYFLFSYYFLHLIIPLQFCLCFSFVEYSIVRICFTTYNYLCSYQLFLNRTLVARNITLITTCNNGNSTSKILFHPKLLGLQIKHWKLNIPKYVVNNIIVIWKCNYKNI